MSQEKGFSLVELLVAVAIAGIVAAIVFPNLTGSRMTANEAATAANLRTFAVKMQVICTSGSSVSFGPACFRSLCPDLLCIRDGYRYNFSTTARDYAVFATPTGRALESKDLKSKDLKSKDLKNKDPGSKDFCFTSDGVVRSRPTTGAAIDPPTCTAMPSI